MLYTLFASICVFVALINKVQSQNSEDLTPANLSLILINSTNAGCGLVNVTGNTGNSQQSINLCLNDDYNYRCTGTNGSNTNGGNIAHRNGNHNVTWMCTLENSNSACHTSFISNENNANITLDCAYKPLLGMILSKDECLYGIYYNLTNNNNSDNVILLCSLWTAPIAVTTFNSTKIFNETPQYYTFPLFGFEVSKHFVKSYGIVILIAIIVVSCLIGICFCGLCNLCMTSMRSKNRRNRSNSNNNNSDDNRRMPQSSNVYNI